MTREHRQANLTVELATRNINDLLASLAQAHEERDALKAEVAELKAKLTPKTEAAS